MTLGLSTYLLGRSNQKTKEVNKKVDQLNDYIIIGERSEKIRNTVTQLDDADVNKRLSEGGWIRK